ncbi:hypothetical protein H5410_051127 [Solanum commersonii]|uniref:Uncharacterized protein n=1 Tax=Solanum commersonii TaxID=4109 RepID=A0A9J5WZK8_SOLCO|nr:hypothetical protein H5410_051127 [Solanum commersonii]
MGRRRDKTYFQLGEDEILLFSSLPKTLSKLERKYPKNYYSILEIKINPRLLKINNKFCIYRHQKIMLPSASLCYVSLDDLVLLRKIIQRNANCFFHRLSDLAPSTLRVLEQRAECVPSAYSQACWAMRRLQLFHSFQLFCYFLCLSVYASTKTSNT